MVAVALGVVLVVASAVVGRMLLAGGANLLLPFPPLLAQWLPHVGPGTPVAAVVAVAVVAYGPALAASAVVATPAARRVGWPRWRGRWRWLWSTAGSAGWSSGCRAARSTCTTCRGSTASREMLATFADHILTDQPVHWTTHVGAHPPGVLLFYVVLDRIGLGGGGAPAW